ncbi:AMP-dependent synthetase/ligase [Salinispira pacifica]|uniref:Long-chain-fatty-acid--CoA ligase n=1 Tax=Salinispira pacifica TaxID=1307761 RepID=V5WM15_9SPIO|nr:class I adenylate-forming enzyme family protein [Salinispira pacifica]AHC16683.1 Long-chain-fatty-acid--CoA ligase [Salinispira pacifica]
MNTPWKLLDGYRGQYFDGEWPSIPEMFAITVNRFPENYAFTSFYPEEIRFTYAEADQLIKSTAEHIRSMGVQKGDRVAVTGKNSPEWAIAYLSVLQAGAVVVPVDQGLSVEQAAGLIKHSGSRIVFSDMEKIHGLRNSCENIDVISLSSGSENYILDLEQKEHTVEPDTPSENDLAAILYTSGTTGSPKGVMLSHRNLSSNVWLAQGNLQIYPTDVFYALLPIHHSYTMTAVFLEAIFVGAEIVFGKQLVFSRIMKDFAQGGVTMFLGVPLLFNKLINGILDGVRKKGIIAYGAIRTLMTISGFMKKIFRINPGKRMFRFLLKQASLENIRICISGGGPLAPSTFRKFNQLGIDFVQGYGLTEASPMLALNPKEKYKENSVGKVLQGVDLRIINANSDGIGDIVAKGPNIMEGYFKQKEATSEAFTEDGFLITGDAGYLDKENYLYLTGRKSSLIVTEGGKNVYPEELEDAFQLYDGYEQILVKGFEKNAATRTEGIEVVFYPGEELLAEKNYSQIMMRYDDITREVNKTLPPFKRIEAIHVLGEPMPMTTTKKIKRQKVNEDFHEYIKLSEE